MISYNYEPAADVPEEYARAIVDPGRRPRGQALVTEGRAAIELVLGTALWLVVAGLTEGLVTPLGIGPWWAVAVGFGLGALYWALVWRLGAPAPAVPVPRPGGSAPGCRGTACSATATAAPRGAPSARRSGRAPPGCRRGSRGPGSGVTRAIR